jgi:hypothetical protein
MPADRPARGSLAELRLRLERLPAGHPSSPYDETGAPRPAPEPLRQLELPLADEDEYPARSSRLTPVAEDRNGASAARAASPAPVSAPSFRAAAGPAGDPAEADRARGEADRRNGFSRSAYGSDPGPDEPALIDPDLDDADLADPELGRPGAGSPEPARALAGEAALGHADLGHADPDLAEFGDADLSRVSADRAGTGHADFGDADLDDAGVGDADFGDADADDRDRHESGQRRNGQLRNGQFRNGQYGTGQYENGRPDRAGPGRYEPDRYEPSPSRSGRNGSSRNGHRGRPDELDDYAGAPPSRGGPRDPDDLAASGLMPRVAGSDPLAPPAPARPGDDTSAGMPRIPAAAGDPLPARNGSRRPGDSRRPDDLAVSGLMPRSEPLPARTGSRPYDDPEPSGLLPRVSAAAPLPARNGARGYGDADVSGLQPRVPADDAPPARNAARAYGDPDVSGLLPRVPADDARPARNGSGRPGSLPPSAPPRGTGTDLPPRGTGGGLPPRAPAGGLPSRTGGRDDPFSGEWDGPDAAAGQNGRSRSRSGPDELERARTAARPGDEHADDTPRRPHAGLTPEQEALADQALSQYQAADGRNVFGGYGESGLTPAMRRVEAHLPHGRLAPGSEENALKSPERYKDKLAKLIARHPGIPAADLAAEIYDAARYTFVFEPQDYTDGTWLVHRRLKAQGFDLEARRNRWDTPEFKGIRTRWRDPAHDLAFEVQFHTPASWDVIQRTHDAYLRITDPRTSAAERASLRERQVAEAAGTRPPARCAEIADFRADVR